MDLTSFDSLFELLESEAVFSWKEFILDDLAILKAILMDPPQQLVEDGGLRRLQSLASRIGSINSSVDLRRLDDDTAFELEMQLFILLVPMQDWKYEAQVFVDGRPKPSRFYYPKIGQLRFVENLSENLEELVKSKADLIGPMKRLFVKLQQVFSSRLMEINEQGKEEANLKSSLNNLTNLAYNVECAIDSFLVREIPVWCCMLLLINILNELEQIEIETTESTTIDDGVVGFKEETKSMLELLTWGQKKLSIVAIVGMAGQGKTTLANKLYNHPSIVDYFHIRACCCVSQVYDKKKLLLELLREVIQDSDTIRDKNDEELGQMLGRSLLKRRFLIFLDDMWNTNAWNDLQRYFPNEREGSRIMFTTRIQELPFQINSDSTLQPVYPLSDDESWELLEKKLFQKERCPLDLQDVGRRIARNCKGLPLSIILTAGILARLEMKEDQWKEIEKTLSSLITRADEGVVDLSYKYLPDRLKLCFLSFGAFSEDKEVPAQKLIRLWAAEGFIKQPITAENEVRQGNDVKSSLEDVAEQYLNDLIGSSLIAIAQRRSDGGIKSCRIHDLVRDFCLAKATEENFLQLVRGYDSNSYSSSPTTYHIRRLCIHTKMNNFIKLKPSGPLVRSLLLVDASDTNPPRSYDISFISQNFKLLRMLDLEEINIGNSLEAIVVLVHLRYLAVQGYFDLVPSSISHLKNLETFLVKGLSVGVLKVSHSIWDLVKLRHFYIYNGGSINFELELENSSSIDNLKTFSVPSLAYGDDMEKILRRLRGLRKLKCIFLDSWDAVTSCNKFPELQFLSQLVSLKVSYNGTGKYPCEFSFPSNLKRLSLSNFRMPWSEISKLASLQNLEVLKLLNNSFVGETWEMGNEVFSKLKFLKLDSLNVVTWSADDEDDAPEDHFPSLEHLKLNKCGNLEEIPSFIGEIPNLQTIEVVWCSPSAVMSAHTIVEEQRDYGKEVKLLVHPKLLDSQLSS